MAKRSHKMAKASANNMVEAAAVETALEEVAKAMVVAARRVSSSSSSTRPNRVVNSSKV